MESYKPEKQNESFNRIERSISLGEIDSKSMSPYLDINLDGYEEQSPFLSEKNLNKFEKNHFIIKNILQDKESLRKIYSIGDRPNVHFLSDEFKGYLEKLSWVKEKYGISPMDLEILSSFKCFGANSLAKERSVVEMLQKIHEARYSAEKMIKAELIARKDMSQNSSEIARLIQEIDISYSHPDHLNFSISRSGSGEYVILLNSKDFDFSIEMREPTLQDRLKVSHEIYHAVFDEIVIPSSEGNIAHKQEVWESSFWTLTEGFATIMELHLNKSMQEYPDKYGLTEQDVIDLEFIQKERIEYLKNRMKENNNLHYWEGVSGIFHKIMKDEGVEGVIDFCKKLDLQKIIDLKTNSNEYINLLNENDANKWIDYLGNE